MTVTVESVQFTARCDGGCGGDARWSGVPAAFGGGTIYRTPRCLSAPACANTPDDGTKQDPDVVDSVTAPRLLPDYVTRLLGRRAS